MRIDRSAAMSGAGNASSPAATATASTPRSRLPRWTRHETLVLLQAKRGMERRGGGERRSSPQPVRLKWAAVSAYCRRHGVERGPMQCRKRWGNLSWDLKKIVAWEKKRKNLAAAAAVENGGEGGDAAEAVASFWDMRGEQRRARQLPSSFDREVYDVLVGGDDAADAAPPFEFGEDLAGDGDDADADADDLPPPPPLMVMPISARKYVPPTASSQQECSDPATVSAKKGGAAASDKNSTSQHDGGGGDLKDSEATYFAGVGAEEGTTTATTTSIGKQVIEALERGNRMLGDHLEAQRAIWDVERQQRTALLAAVNKVADAVGRIADKL